MDQNSQISESQTFAYKQVQSNCAEYCTIQVFEVIRRDPKLIKFNDWAQKYGFQSSVPIQQLGEQIGKGGYGEVYQVTHHLGNFYCALKIQRKCELQVVYKLIEEFQLQKFIGNHYPQNIIQLRDKIAISQQNQNEYTINAYLDIAEYSLAEFTKKQKLNDLQIEEIYDQVLDCIINLHSLKIAHRDIKPQNILYEKEKGWVLADFGCSVQYSQPYGLYELKGTKVFIPLKLRQKLKEITNQQQSPFIMNLLQNDLYAFQLTILILINPEANIMDLQKILDQQKSTHYLIDSLYNQNYFTLKNWFKSRQYKRINQQTKEVIGEKQMNQLLLRFFQDKQAKYEVNLMDKLLLDLRIQNFHQQQFEYITNFDKKYQFNIQKQLQLCQGFQNCVKDNLLKFQEAKLQYILGNFKEAKSIINNLNEFEYMQNDEQFIQFQILKSRLNGYWWKICDEIINAVKKNVNLNKIQPESRKSIEWEFLLMGQIKEEKSIITKIFKQNNNNVLLKPEREYFLNQLFDHCWEVKTYYHMYSFWFGSLSEAIKIIEENYPNYYFNWMLYYQDAIFHIIKGQYEQALQSANKALNYIKEEECFVNKYRVYFLIWISYLNLGEAEKCKTIFTTLLEWAQLTNAPKFFKDFFFYFSVAIQNEETIKKSISFSKSFLEDQMDQVINDSKIMFFFFQMLSKYYIFEWNEKQLHQLINKFLVNYYLNNNDSDQLILEVFKNIALYQIVFRFKQLTLKFESDKQLYNALKLYTSSYNNQEIIILKNNLNHSIQMRTIFDDLNYTHFNYQNNKLFKNNKNNQNISNIINEQLPKSFYYINPKNFEAHQRLVQFNFAQTSKRIQESICFI